MLAKDDLSEIEKLLRPLKEDVSELREELKDHKSDITGSILTLRAEHSEEFRSIKRRVTDFRETFDAFAKQDFLKLPPVS